MRIVDPIPTPIRRARRQIVSAIAPVPNHAHHHSKKPANQNGNSQDWQEGTAPWLKYDSGFIAQFIHQEIVPDGLHAPNYDAASQKYRQANENHKILPPQSKISV